MTAHEAKGSKLNKAWHEANRMPRNAKLQQRIDWHLEHSRNCACRPIPPRLQAEIDRAAARRA